MGKQTLCIGAIFPSPHVLNHPARELAGLRLRRAQHLPLKVIRHELPFGELKDKHFILKTWHCRDFTGCPMSHLPELALLYRLHDGARML